MGCSDNGCEVRDDASFAIQRNAHCDPLIEIALIFRMPDSRFPITWNPRKCLMNQGSWNYTKFSKVRQNKKMPLVILGKDRTDRWLNRWTDWGGLAMVGAFWGQTV